MRCCHRGLSLGTDGMSKGTEGRGVGGGGKRREEALPVNNVSECDK